MHARPDAHKVPCPTCQAAVNRSCRSATGRRRKPHAKRIERADPAVARRKPSRVKRRQATPDELRRIFRH